MSSLSTDEQVDIQATLSALVDQIDGNTTAEGTVSYGSVIFPLNELEIALRFVADRAGVHGYNGVCTK